MRTHTPTQAKRFIPLHMVALGIVSIASSFALGVRTSGNVETIAPSRAEGLILTGDMNGDAQLTIADAIAVLEIAQGYDTPTAEQLKADPNGDGKLTVDDAVRILHDISSR